MIYNDAYSVFAGGRHPKLFGSKVREGWPEVADFNDNIMKVGLTGRTLAYRDIPLTLYRHDGKPEQVWLNLDYSPILADDGNPAGVMAIVVENTERVLVERELEAERQSLKRMFEQAPGFIAMLSGPAHRFTMVNEAYRSLVAGRDVIGKPVAEALPEVVDQGFVQLLDRVYASGKTYIGRRVAIDFQQRHDGVLEQRHLDFVYQPIVAEDGTTSGIFIQGQDVTEQHDAEVAIRAEVAERRRAEEALQALNNTLEQRVLDEVYARSKAEEQLRQIQKMEAVGQLTGGIAHDFNNMLAVVISALNLLQRKLKRGDANVQEFIDAAVEGAQRAAALTQRLLAFARQQPLSPEPLQVDTFIASMTELLTRTLGEHIVVETSLGQGIWHVNVDRAQLESTIINLAVNARDAMPDGGKLKITTQNLDVNGDRAVALGIDRGKFVCVSVTDTGIGMTSHVLAKAFEPFFTTKAVGKGTGLGLSQVYGFVRQSGGHIKLESDLGVGTSVKIYLPRHDGPIELTGRQAYKDTASRGHPTETILVVEDDARVRAMSSSALKELGYAVIEAPGPLEALTVLDTDERIGLLFTDVVMPAMSGRQLADLARDKRPSLKVLYTTGYTRNALENNGTLESGTNLLTKPFSIDDLGVKIRSVLDTPA